MISGTSRKVALLLGTAVSISLVNVLGTVTFNLSVWVAFARGGVLISDAYSRVLEDPEFAVLTYTAQALAAAMGGFTASALGPNKPYTNAVLTSVLLMAWYVVMYTTPIITMTSSAAHILAMFFLPIPSALAGAHVHHRVRARSGNGNG